MSRRFLTVAASAVAALTLVLAPAAGASAHDTLVSSDPAADATVTTPLSQVALTFSDNVLDLSGTGTGTLLVVTGPDGGARHFETGCAAIAGPQVTAPVALGAGGQYTVTYQVVSADGHTVSSSYAFTYQPPEGTPEAAGSEATPCGAATPSETPTPEPTMSTLIAPSPDAKATEAASTPKPVQSTGQDNTGLLIGVMIAIGVLIFGGGLVVLLTARRKPPQATAPAEELDAATPGDTDSTGHTEGTGDTGTTEPPADTERP